MIILRNFSKIEFPDEMFVVSKKTGETIKLEKYKPSAFTRFLQKMWNLFGSSSSINCTSFTIYDKNKDEIGDLDLEHISDEELHIEWILLEDNKQNLGYGKAILRSIIDFAKDNGYKIISLEVPSGKSQRVLGTSDSAKSVYESLGFITTGKVSRDGLIEMKLDLSRVQKTFSKKDNEEEKPSIKKQALISGGVGLTSGLGIGGLTYHTLNKDIDDKVKKHVKTEVNALNSGRNRISKILGEEGIKELDSRISNLKSSEYAKEFKNGLKKAARNKALRNGGIVSAVAGGLALAKTRGELDKDHLKASLDVDPFRAVGGHIAINKGDKKLKQSLEEGKTQAQAIRDARDEAEKVSTKAGKISSLAFGTGTAIMGGKIIKNGWKKALENPLLGKAVAASPELANIVMKTDPIIKKHAGKIGVGLGALSVAKGLALSKATSKRSKNVMEKRAIKQLAEEDDKRMNNDSTKK